MENRFFFNPLNGQLLNCGQSSHSCYAYNKKLSSFDSFIRGIIVYNTLYLRTFYPFNDLSDLTYNDLQIKSRALLNQYIKDISRAVKKSYNIEIKKIILNAENDLLKGILLNV